MKKIEIKNIFERVIFEFEAEGNNLKKTVEKAVKEKVSLNSADLSGADLKDAYLNNADLSNANLSGADLKGAYLNNADLKDAYLNNADLSCADLSCADLSYAYLNNANLSCASLRNADLNNADLKDANLIEANLIEANLRNADLNNADLSNVRYNNCTLMFNNLCPDGEFVAYKKAGNKIVKLLIPAGAKRSNSTSYKCRCNKAKVLEIQEIDGTKSAVDKVSSGYDNEFWYKVGETVEVLGFDENKWNECSNGIHFFIDRRLAVNVLTGKPKQ